MQFLSVHKLHVSSVKGKRAFTMLFMMHMESGSVKKNRAGLLLMQVSENGKIACKSRSPSQTYYSDRSRSKNSKVFHLL